MAAPTAESQPPRKSSANLILSITIALVCLLVLALLGVLWASARLDQEMVGLRGTLRAIRMGAIDFSQSYADAESAHSAYLLSQERQRLADFRAAKTEARLRIAELRRITAGEPEGLALVARIEALAERDFGALDAALPPRRPAAARATDNALRSATNELHSYVVRRSDLSRATEEGSRQRLNSLALALAGLSLIMSALAVLALRRERGQWRKAAEALAEAHAKAEASDLAKTRFLATASHDMRQPLHALMLYIGALQRRVDTDEARDILAKMDRAAASMSGMFSTLLDLARIQANVVTPEIVVFPLRETIDSVVGEYPDANIAAPAVAFDVRTDPVLLERMLRNLVSNALRHGGGDVRIDVKPAGELAEITVSDNGPGIRPEDQDRIFDEFVRLDGRASGEGLGLGLAIVKRIADLLGLQLELRSSPGAGASFIVHVPMVVSGVGAVAHVASNPDALRGLRILAMDDDPLALEAVAGSLKDLGADIRACAREAEVMETLDKGFSPEVLVMDLRIDGELAGIDIANRALTRAPNARVVMVTGDTGPETLAALRASGHQWLIKPVNPRDLIEAVETAGQRAAEPAASSTSV